MPQSSGIIRPFSFLLIQVNRVLDLVCIFACLFIVVRIADPGPFVDLFAACAVAATVFTISAQLKNLYRSWRIAPLHEELSVIWSSWAISASVTVAGAYFFDAFASITKTEFAYWLCAVPVVISGLRVIIRLGLRFTRRAGRNFRTAAVVGVTASGRQIAERLRFNKWMGIQVVGYFDERSPTAGRVSADGPFKVVGNFQDLVDQAAAGTIDMVYIALPMRAELRVNELIERLADSAVLVYYVADFGVFDALHAQWETVGELPVLRVINTPFQGFNSAVKRVEDIIIGTTMLGFLLVPMVLIAIVIKLSSPGPVIFRQLRHGLDGAAFQIYKFRSMVSENDPAPFRQATRGDERTTRFGRFLRRTSLDELPQLLNVLQGRMSLVGPRPHPIALNDEHSALIRRYALRHKVKPGITGWAQINGYRGETETTEKMQRRVELDLDYINHWSVWLDLRILMKTAFLIWKDRNAY